MWAHAAKHSPGCGMASLVASSSPDRYDNLKLCAAYSHPGVDLGARLAVAPKLARRAD